jgi:hypothetical protein
MRTPSTGGRSLAAIVGTLTVLAVITILLQGDDGTAVVQESVEFRAQFNNYAGAAEDDSLFAVANSGLGGAVDGMGSAVDDADGTTRDWSTLGFSNVLEISPTETTSTTTHSGESKATSMTPHHASAVEPPHHFYVRGLGSMANAMETGTQTKYMDTPNNQAAQAEQVHQDDEQDKQQVLEPGTERPAESNRDTPANKAALQDRIQQTLQAAADSLDTPGWGHTAVHTSKQAIPAYSAQAQASNQQVLAASGNATVSTFAPTYNATEPPTEAPTPTYPTNAPTPTYPTEAPTPTYPTSAPTPTHPTEAPTPTYPTSAPTPPTFEPTRKATDSPAAVPVSEPTAAPESSNGNTGGTATVIHAAQVTVRTAEGSVRLQSYLKKVEAELAKEAIDRKAGLAEMKSMVEQSMQYNKDARHKLEKALRTQMEDNANEAKAHLETALKDAAEALEKQMAARDEMLQTSLEAGSRHAEQQLQQAVDVWSKSQAALASETNEHIKQLHSSTAANAALIKANAQEAQDGIMDMMAKFTNEMAASRAETASSIAGLSAQVESVDQTVRQQVQSKLNTLVSLEATRFQDERLKMADRRHEMDMQLVHSAARLQACLNALHALQDPTFADTVHDLHKVTLSAKKLAAAAVTEFKMAVAAIGAVVRQQTSELEVAKGQVTQAIPKGGALLAKIEAVTLGEMKELVTMANAKYTALKHGDPELQRLVASNHAATPKQLTLLAQEFHTQLQSLRDKARAAVEEHTAEAGKAALQAYSQMAEAMLAQKHSPEADITAEQQAHTEDALNARWALSPRLSQAMCST